MSPFVFSILIYLLLFLVSTVAFNDVVTIYITTADDPDAGTINTVQITLWFNYTIYQHALQPSLYDHVYSITNFTTLGPSDCHKSPSATPEAKIMIENNHGDGLVIDRVAFLTSSNTMYGIRRRCVDDALLTTHSWLYDKEWALYIANETSCDSGTANIWLCIDNQKDDCEPAKQVFYFDTSRASEYIPNATWSDGTNVMPEIVSCDPTSRPTNNPTLDTMNPTIITKAPSVSPTPMPTSYPSQPPSDKPTFSPTKPPITMNPTVFPFANPSTGTPSTNPTALTDTIYTQPTELLSQHKKPVDIILILILSLIGFLCINVLITIAFVCFVRHKKRVLAQTGQHMTDDNGRNDVEVKETDGEQVIAPNSTKVENEPSLQEVDEDDHDEGEHVEEVRMTAEGNVVTNGVEPDEFIVRGDDEMQEAQTTKY